METGLVKYIESVFAVDIPENTTREQLELILAGQINHLIPNDFPALLNILYRVDVSEQKLKTLLKENADVDAGLLIAAMIIDRQLEKQRSRQQDRDDKNIIDDNERW